MTKDGKGCLSRAKDDVILIDNYVFIFSVLVNKMPKSARYHIDRANSIVFTSKRLPLQPVSSERNHQESLVAIFLR